MSAQCTSCGAPIWWARTPKGRRIPIDAESNPKGTIMVIDGVAHVVGSSRTLDPADTGRRWVTHYATCPNAKSHRSAKGRS